MGDVKRDLERIAEAGKQAEVALQRLAALQAAEADDADLEAVKAGVQLAEAGSDFALAARLKARQLALLRKGGL